MRNFQFAFKLYPHSKTEADTIHEIIKTLRKASLPSKTNNTAFLGYPDIFDISYWIGSDKNEYLHKFKPAALVSIDTDFTASSQWAQTRDGFPAEINLILNFTEEEIVIREDVDLGF